MAPKRGSKHKFDCRHCATQSEFMKKNNPMHRPEVAKARGEAQRGEANVMKRPEVRAKRSRSLRENGKMIGNKNGWGSGRLKGVPLSESHRRNLRESLAQSEKFQKYLHSHCGTAPEVMMAAILMWTGVAFTSQKHIGSRVVDFYLPDSNSVIEVDGVYWHSNGPDEKRDAYLLERVSAVHHVTDEELRLGGWC